METIPGNRAVTTGKPDRKEEKKEDKKECPRCNKDITLEELKQIYTEANDVHLKELVETLNKYKKVFKLDTCARKAHFFAQSREESGADLSGALHGESLDYAAEALPIQFKKFRKRNSKEEAVDKFGNPTTENKKTVPNELAYQYGRSSRNGYKANQKMIAEIAYGDRGGNLTPEDAWNFRGRGLLQITFRSTYEEIQKLIDKLASDSGVKISDGKNRDYTPKEAALTGMLDWYKDNMFLKADLTGKFTDDDVVDLIVDIINRDTDSRAKRKKHYKKTKVIFKVDNCSVIKKTGKQKKYDIDKAVAYIDSNALSKSKGICALYVRKAINAGGILNLSGHAREYYDTDKLVKVGFTKLGNDINTIQLKKGDIAAFGAVKGHPYGHIAMYNGSQWVSDFKQKSFWVATQYSVEKKYAIYRWNK
jgi:predicted chitinase